MNPRKLFEKIGRRYRPIGHEFTGFPSPGVWIVEKRPGHREQRFIMKVAELPDLQPMVKLEVHRHRLVEAISKELKAPHSPDSLAKVVIDTLASLDEANRG